MRAARMIPARSASARENSSSRAGRRKPATVYEGFGDIGIMFLEQWKTPNAFPGARCRYHQTHREGSARLGSEQPDRLDARRAVVEEGREPLGPRGAILTHPALFALYG
jgi:hypothetical protein